MNSLSRRIISAGGLTCWILFATALAAPENYAERPEPVAGQSLIIPLTNHLLLDLAWIPPGTFLMGSPAVEQGHHADEGPQTQVTLTKGFWLGKTFVTIGQWKEAMGLDVRRQLIKAINDDTLYDLAGKKQTMREFMHWSRGADPASYLGNEDDDLPMYFVSWSEATKFAQTLTLSAAGSVPLGYEFSLPTEAQWEYACRAGTTEATYAGPNDANVLDQIAWYDRNSAIGYVGRPIVPSHFGPRKIGLKKPNAWGLYDMQGNLWQWCLDWYGPYPGGHVVDPRGPKAGDSRVNRGGSFGSGGNSERSAARAANPQPEASAYRGFRIALSPIPSAH